MKLTSRDMSKITLKAVTNNVKEDLKIRGSINKTLHKKLIAGDTLKNDKAAENKVDVQDPSHVEYYISRGLEEVSNVLRDINFSLNDVLGKGKVSVKNISLPEDGSAVIEFIKTMQIDDEEGAKNLGALARSMTIRDEFARYVTFAITPPASLKNDVSMSVKVRVPSNYIDTLIKDRSNMSKTVKTLEKYSKDLLKELQ